jgi:hypothetical protein
MGHISSPSQPAGFHYPKNSKGPELCDRQAGRQAGRQADRQAGRQAGRQADRQAGRQAG